MEAKKSTAQDEGKGAMVEAPKTRSKPRKTRRVSCFFDKYGSRREILVNQFNFFLCHTRTNTPAPG